MALTELNQPVKADLYRSVSGIATREINHHHGREISKGAADQVTGTDLTEMAVPAEVQTLLVNYREALQILSDAFESSLTPTNGVTVRAAFEAVRLII